MEEHKKKKKLKRKFALELKLNMEKKKNDMQNAAWEVKKTSLEATFKDKNLQWVSKKKRVGVRGLRLNIIRLDPTLLVCNWSYLTPRYQR